MKNPSLLMMAIAVLLFSACAGETASPTATPDLKATLDAAIEQTLAAQPTSTATGTSTLTLTATFTPAPTEIPTETPTPEPTEEKKSFTVENLENGWSRYVYQEDQFAISIPPDWLYFDLGAEDFDQMLAMVGENNPQLGKVYTSSYLRNLAAAGIKLMAVDRSTNSLSAGVPTSLNVLVNEMLIPLELDEVVAVTLQQLKTFLGSSDLLQNESVKINGVDAEKFMYEAEINDILQTPHKVVFHQYLLVQNGKQYVLTFGTVKESADDNTAIFAEIADSFELIP